MRLTVKRVERKTQPGKYLDGRGLYLQVVSENNRSWIFRYKKYGKTRWVELGSTKDFSLDQAREFAHSARQLLKQDIGPLTQKWQRQDAAKLAADVWPELCQAANANEFPFFKCFTILSTSSLRGLVTAAGNIKCEEGRVVPAILVELGLFFEPLSAPVLRHFGSWQDLGAQLAIFQYDPNDVVFWRDVS